MLAIVVPSTFASEESPHVYHYTKGKVDQKSQFAGEVVWTLIDGSSGALVHSSPNGIVVLRFDLSFSTECVGDIGLICLDAKITSVKNTKTHNVGEKLKLTLDPQNTLTVSIITGPLKGSNILIDMEKYRIPEPEEIAKKFTIANPTFKYDGIKNTLNAETVSVMESFPEQYVVSVDFTSRHGGYGDRTDQIVTQVLTEHSMRVVVSNGMVKSAIIDDRWDEIIQKPTK